MKHTLRLCRIPAVFFYSGWIFVPAEEKNRIGLVWWDQGGDRKLFDRETGRVPNRNWLKY